MRSISLATGAVAVVLAASSFAGSAPATVHTLTFDQSNACDTTCGNFSALSDHYGSDSSVLISYASYDASHNLITGHMYSWHDQYGDLTDIAFAQGGDCCAVGEITFQALHGATFTFLDLNIASWPNTDRQSQVSLFDLGHNLVGQTGPFTAPGNGHQTVSCFGCSTTTGFILQFGPDAYNTGIDNVRFDVSGGGVPEPAAWGLMLMGFGAMGGALRMRRKAALAA